MSFPLVGVPADGRAAAAVPAGRLPLPLLPRPPRRLVNVVDSHQQRVVHDLQTLQGPAKQEEFTLNNQRISRALAISSDNK